jgi:exosortase
MSTDSSTLTDSSDSGALRASSWQPLLVIAAILSLFLLVNPQIIADWRVYSFDDGTYSHAYLIPLMMAYLLWEAHQDGELELRWNPVYFGLFLLALLAYQFLEIAQQRYPARMLLPAVPLLATLALIKTRLAPVAALALLWFITPVWGVTNEMLQTASVWAVNHLMGFTGIPTYVWGNYVQIPAGTFEIADGCSGLRYLISALALCLFYAVLYLRKPSSIVLLFAIAIVGSLITNWLRITALVLIGHFTDMQSPIIADHNMFGWFLFIPFIVVLFYFAGRMEPPRISGAGAVNPQAVSRRGLWLVVGSLLLLSGMNLSLLQSGRLQLVAPIVDVEGADLQSESLPGIVPQFFRASSVERSAQDINGLTLHSVILNFAGSSDADRAEFYKNNPVPEGWEVLEVQTQEEPRQLLISRDNQEFGLVAYWYEAAGYRAGNTREMRWARLHAATRLNRETAMYWYFLPCSDANCEQARNAMDAFFAESP